VQSALRKATETFASELAAPGSAAPDWNPFEWTMAKAAAVLHGVTPLMAGTLRWSGPPDWQQFVAEQRRHTAARQQRIYTLLAQLDAMARQARIPFIALKGSALHAQGLYSAGQRPMADIDLLVSDEAASPLCELLRALGYHETFGMFRHRILEPRQSELIAGAVPAFGENEHAPIKIEVHTHLSERLAAAVPDISQHVLPPALPAGLNAYPSQSALMTHLLLHAAGNVVAHALRLIHLHDIALLGSRLESHDWEQLLRLRVSGRAMWWAVPPLQLAHRYYHGCVPKDVLTELSRSCPRGLVRLARSQRLSDVSYATLGRESFPGLAWTASLSEKLSCIRTRFRPGPEQRAVAQVARKEPWAANRWTELSHTQRLLRQAFTRPPRLQPMYVVHAAIAASKR
jgi:hypothetical protein